MYVTQHTMCKGEGNDATYNVQVRGKGPACDAEVRGKWPKYSDCVRGKWPTYSDCVRGKWPTCSDSVRRKWPTYSDCVSGKWPTNNVYVRGKYTWRWREAAHDQPQKINRKIRWFIVYKTANQTATSSPPSNHRYLSKFLKQRHITKPPCKTTSTTAAPRTTASAACKSHYFFMESEAQVSLAGTRGHNEPRQVSEGGRSVR